jgi:hypothetical protein
VILVLVAQAAVVAAFVVGLRSGAFPLGVPGEWTWSRLPEGIGPTALGWLTGAVTLAVYAGFAALGSRSLSGERPGPLRESAWLSALAVMAVAAQVGLQSAAPEGYGLTKWTFALHSPGSNGYYTVARTQMADPWRFWGSYPTWIAGQDALHTGTHPPGLFLAWRAVLGTMRENPGLARAVVSNLPGPVVLGFREIDRFDPLPPADRAALAAVGALTLLACALTVVPLYGLARTRLPASHAWAAATLWPLIPSAILFQPTADTAFPLLSTAALALAARGRRASSFGAGLVLAVGMSLTLAFLAVGAVVAIVHMTDKRISFWRRVERVAWTGLGFVSLTLAGWAVSGANPLAIWWWNQRKHAQFYVEYPRAYGAWMLANPIELAVAIGLPTALWALVGLPRAGRATWATLAVLALLQVSGRNLSEVARLWLPLTPPLLIAAAAGMERLEGRAGTLAVTMALVVLQTLALQATIQVVYGF